MQATKDFLQKINKNKNTLNPHPIAHPGQDNPMLANFSMDAIENSPSVLSPKLPARTFSNIKKNIKKLVTQTRRLQATAIENSDVPSLTCTEICKIDFTVDRRSHTQLAVSKTRIAYVLKDRMIRTLSKIRDDSSRDLLRVDCFIRDVQMYNDHIVAVAGDEIIAIYDTSVIPAKVLKRIHGKEISFSRCAWSTFEDEEDRTFAAIAEDNKLRIWRITSLLNSNHTDSEESNSEYESADSAAPLVNLAYIQSNILVSDSAGQVKLYDFDKCDFSAEFTPHDGHQVDYIFVTQTNDFVITVSLSAAVAKVWRADVQGRFMNAENIQPTQSLSLQVNINPTTVAQFDPVQSLLIIASDKHRILSIFHFVESLQGFQFVRHCESNEINHYVSVINDDKTLEIFTKQPKHIRRFQYQYDQTVKEEDCEEATFLEGEVEEEEDEENISLDDVVSLDPRGASDDESDINVDDSSILEDEGSYAGTFDSMLDEIDPNDRIETALAEQDDDYTTKDDEDSKDAPIENEPSVPELKLTHHTANISHTSDHSHLPVATVTDSKTGANYNHVTEADHFNNSNNNNSDNSNDDNNNVEVKQEEPEAQPRSESRQSVPVIKLWDLSELEGDSQPESHPPNYSSATSSGASTPRTANEQKGQTAIKPATNVAAPPANSPGKAKKRKNKKAAATTAAGGAILPTPASSANNNTNTANQKFTKRQKAKAAEANDPGTVTVLTKNNAADLAILAKNKSGNNITAAANTASTNNNSGVNNNAAVRRGKKSAEAVKSVENLFSFDLNTPRDSLTLEEKVNRIYEILTVQEREREAREEALLNKLVSRLEASKESQTLITKSLNDKFTKLSESIKNIRFEVPNQLKEPIKREMHDFFQNVVNPATELTCQQLFRQIDSSFQEGVQKHFALLQQSTAAQTANHLSETVSNLTRVCDAMVNNIQASAPHVNGVAGSNAVRASPVVSSVPVDENRIAIDEALKQFNYQDAFFKALCSSNLNTVLYLLSKVQPFEVFTPKLKVTPSILLCLLQQLSADLQTATSVKLHWMLESLPRLDVNDHTVHAHVPETFRGILANLMNAKPYITDGESLLKLNYLISLFPMHESHRRRL